MRPFVYCIGTVLIFTLWPPTIDGAGAIRTPPIAAPLKVEAFYVLQAPKGMVVVTLINWTDRTASSVSVDLWLASRLQGSRGSYVISAHSSRVVTFPITKSSSAVYVVVRFITRGVEDSEAQLIRAPVPVLSQGSSGLGSLFTLGAAILSLIGVLLGALLGHFLTGRREFTRSRFEWQKMLYERHEQAYVSFLADWASSTNLSVLEEQFDRLKAAAPVPASVVSVYHDVRNKLADTGSTPEEKRSAADLLYGRVSDFMAAPWRQRKG